MRKVKNVRSWLVKGFFGRGTTTSTCLYFTLNPLSPVVKILKGMSLLLPSVVLRVTYASHVSHPNDLPHFVAVIPVLPRSPLVDRLYKTIVQFVSVLWRTDYDIFLLNRRTVSIRSFGFSDKSEFSLRCCYSLLPYFETPMFFRRRDGERVVESNLPCVVVWFTISDVYRTLSRCTWWPVCRIPDEGINWCI